MLWRMRHLIIIFLNCLSIFDMWRFWAVPFALAVDQSLLGFRVAVGFFCYRILVLTRDSLLYVALTTAAKTFLIVLSALSFQSRTVLSAMLSSLGPAFLARQLAALKQLSRFVKKGVDNTSMPRVASQDFCVKLCQTEECQSAGQLPSQTVALTAHGQLWTFNRQASTRFSITLLLASENL